MEHSPNPPNLFPNLEAFGSLGPLWQLFRVICTHGVDMLLVALEIGSLLLLRIKSFLRCCQFPQPTRNIDFRIFHSHGVLICIGCVRLDLGRSLQVLWQCPASKVVPKLLLQSWNRGGCQACRMGCVLEVAVLTSLLPQKMARPSGTETEPTLSHLRLMCQACKAGCCKAAN